MSLVYMGFSLGDDLEMKERRVVQMKDDTRESRNNGFDLETEFDFGPIQHPTEPSHEDRPVQCPMPHSSHLINDEKMQDDRFVDHKKSEAKTVLHKDNNELEVVERPAIRMVRKRHHDHTNTIIPLHPMSPMHPYSHQKTVFNKLQQIHKFES
ncbi:hypothetical protein L1987_87071 [Smallanthus sonchifolius]|nr:hypothetical protein L1987_87071 [Smallanthus sonchifolius]